MVTRPSASPSGNARAFREAARRNQAPSATRAKPAAPDTLLEGARKLRTVYAGHPVRVLDVPWEEREVPKVLGADRPPILGKWVIKDSQAVGKLRDYFSQDYSFDRWIEDTINGNLRPVQEVARFAPRPHQITAIKKITLASREGHRGFILADAPGVGKSISAAVGLAQVAKDRGFTAAKPAQVLILAPKSALDHWRHTLRALNYLMPHMHIMLINYEQIKKLLSTPASATAAKKTKTKNKHIAEKGLPIIRWDLIIADESHKLANTESQVSQAFAKVARYASPVAQAPFIIWASATIGQNPVSLSYLAPLITGKDGKHLVPAQWLGWLKDNGYHIESDRFGTHWVAMRKEDSPARREQVRQMWQEDTTRLSGLFFAKNAPAIRRRPEQIAGWPALNIIPTPYSLNTEQLYSYRRSWKDFRESLKMKPRGRGGTTGAVEQLRFRQKASLIQVPYTTDFVLDLLDSGLQVALSVEFLESLKEIKLRLVKAGVSVAEFTGENEPTRESERLRFQRGQARVILFTVTEAVSFHAGETLPDGSRASNAVRATVVHDVRWSAIAMEQIAGRAHRDGQSSNIYYFYAADTVQGRVYELVVNKMRATKGLSGDDDAVLEEIDLLLLSEKEPEILSRF